MMTGNTTVHGAGADRADHQPPSARPDTFLCRDLDVWQRALMDAPGLAATAPDPKRTSGERTIVSAANVKAVGAAMRTYMDGPSRKAPGSNARPGWEAIAERLELSRRQVLGALARLVDTGYLHQDKRGHTGQRAEFSAALPGDVARSLIASSKLADHRATPVDNTAEGASGRTLLPPVEGERVRQDAREGVSGRTQEGASGRTPTSALDLRMTSSPPQPPEDIGTGPDHPPQVGEGGEEEPEDPKATAQPVLQAVHARLARASVAMADRMLDEWDAHRRKDAMRRLIARALATGWTEGDVVELLAEDLGADVNNLVRVMHSRLRDRVGEHQQAPLAAVAPDSTPASASLRDTIATAAAALVQHPADRPQEADPDCPDCGGHGTVTVREEVSPHRPPVPVEQSCSCTETNRGAVVA